MLEPEFLNLIEFNDVVNIYTQLNIDITAEIIKRVSAMDDITTATTDQIKVLKETNGDKVFFDALEKTSLLTTQTKNSLRTIYKSMAKNDIKSYVKLYQYRGKPFKLSEHQYKILNAGMKRTQKQLKNFTNSIAFNSKQSYIEAVDEAYQKAISGAFDYNTAISQAVQKLADKGITLKDKAGRKQQLEVAVRRNVLSGIRDTARAMDNDIENELGCNGKEMDAHEGARPTHAEVQGKQYAYTKADAKKYGVGFWGDVKDLLEEYGCRHDAKGIVLGVSKPTYTEKELEEMKNASVTLNGTEVPLYEATQKQRQLENNIRKIKRSIAILEKSGQDATDEKIKLTAYNKRLNSFCKETGLAKDYSRMKIAK